MDYVYKMEENRYIDESKYREDYQTKKRKCSKHGCDIFSCSFTNNINFCDSCFYEIKFFDKIAELNYLKEYVMNANSDPIRLLDVLKKERDKIIQLEDTLEIKEDQIESLEYSLEAHSETDDDTQYEIDSLSDLNEQLQEEIIQLQELLKFSEKPKESSEETC